MNKDIELLCTGLTFCDLVFQGLSRIPALGEETACEDFSLNVGGAANTPVAAARLGLKTAYVSCAGEDWMGALVLKRLNLLGLNTENIVCAPGSRTCVTAVLSVGEERGFASYFSEQDYAAIEARLRKLAPRARVLHASLLDAIKLPLAAVAHENGCLLSVDAAFEEAIPENLPRLRDFSVFFANQEEVYRLTGEKDPARAAESLSQYVPRVVIKLGGEGALSMINGEILFAPAFKPEKLIDTTGAGDCFCAGYLYALCRGLSPIECLKYGNAAGALNVSYAGGMNEKMTLENLKAILRA